MEGKVAVLGDADFVMPFSALGLDTFAIGEGPAEAVELAKQIIELKYGLVVVAENVAAAVEGVFGAQQNMPIPCVVVVPSTVESEGFATMSLTEMLRMATGTNILQSN